MERGPVLYLLTFYCSIVAALEKAQMFPYGTLSGDSLLEEGDDETSKVLSLPKPFYFYDTPFSQLYVATNGIISAQDLPMEKQYVDDSFPTDFPVVAPFLADMDTSGRRGQIYYRVTETPNILNRVAQEVQRGFPDAKFTPNYAVVATWENVAAYNEPTRTNGGTSNEVNTFQAVIGYDEIDSYVLFLYPEGGLNFFGTRPKESYNVEIELPARVGFSRGEVTYLIFSRTDGPHYSVTGDQQSIKRLYQAGNTGTPGVWLFHTGNYYSFENIVPASSSGLLSTLPPREHALPLDTTTPEYSDSEEYTDSSNFDPANEEEEEDYPLTGEDLEFQPELANESLQPRSSNPPSSASEDSARQASHSGQDLPLTSEPRHNSESVESQYLPHPHPRRDMIPDGGDQRSHGQKPQVPVEVVDLYPSHRNQPPLSPGGHVVSVDEDDIDFDTGVIQYTTENKETCARFQQQCSQNAFCSDYATGFCCHCQPGFYGNGRHCLPKAAPQRVSGKLSGTVIVGMTPVELNQIDLHAYIVVGDGRAYTAVSEIPEPVGWALMPAAPIGELFGWLFALELPNSQAGFKTTGAEFTRHVELIFYPGNQRLSITQTGRGLDDHNHLTVDTMLNGSVPFLPPGAEVTMDPFKETYHYYPSVATSTSVREFTVVSPDKGSESFSFQMKQNITYRDCRHDSRAPPVETLQITMERVFVMYVKEERILRYAITNKISPVGAGPTGPEVRHPCYDGSHDCDTTAQCIPLEGQAFQCRCATGYKGDGHNCYDVDECAEGSATCGAHSQCVNLPGSHRCQCQSGYEFGFDGRTCVDVDECRTSPCHTNARCTNSLGSFYCDCQTGFYGDGFLCSQQEDKLERPKSHCEHHRDSVQTTSPEGYPLVGAFVPECDANGQYTPQQCHGSSGHCWCVDSQGKERPGTRTLPGTTPTDCDKPERPKSHCEHHRDRVQTTSPEGYPLVGAFVPECDASGQYTPQQCHGSSGHCWCVDSQGQERPGTRTPPGTTPTNCDEAEKPQRPKSHCEHYRDSVQTTNPEGYPLVGAFVPECDANGQYTPQQCHGSTGHCWCVDNQGQERSGTRTPPGTTPTDCDKPERPKTHCEQHRDRVQTTSPEGYPLVGAFLPECDANGQYTPQQCHGSSGHCWCVDSQGQERSGTRTPPGTTPTDCDKPERPKTHCEQHRDRVQTTSPEGYPLVGAFLPECDANGQYTHQQCHGSSGHCWCVDSQGQERSGTRTPPGTTPTDCDKPERPKTHCEQHRDRVQTTSAEGYPLVGAFVPECDDNGQYTPQQCHGSSGHCWCVDSRGQERSGTRTPPGTTPADCDKPERPKTHCEHHRGRVQTTSAEGYPLVGAFVPECDANGQYTPQQCHGSTGYCWCVDNRGQEREGTRTPAGTAPINCDTLDGPQVKTQCVHHRDSVQTTISQDSSTVGGYIPQCDADGQYTPLQCHGSTGHCWCVDSQGQERPGTRTRPGVPPTDCDNSEESIHPKTHCEHLRDRVQTTSPEGYPLVGAFVPQCDANGQYTPQQCDGSSGHCWCVNSQGQERPGTRTPPSTTPMDCDKPEHPKTHCEHHRDGVQTTSPEGYPIVGAFVPECDTNGQYTPQQCHGSSGHCWCVDSQGQERPGTRTPPGTTPVNCDKPDERPKSLCEHNRDIIQTTSLEGYPPVGAFVPQCDATGQYRPQQCHGSTGHCWCVDSQGQERPGTRTPSGTTPMDCDKPQRPKSHCEHHRDRVQTTSPEGYPLVGAFVPQCDANGQYTPQQCHGSSGHCWCVNSQGQERPGTRTSPGTTPMHCDNQDERPKTHCEHLRDGVQTNSPEGYPLVGAFVPQCDINGQYRPQQCDGSTGHCWCVDNQGQERPGTRTPPSTTPIDCDKPEHPKTHCENHRDRVQTTTPEGYPLVGAFVPECDPNGQYTPQQCHGSSGHCWCVDVQGQERPGTRTPPGTTPTDCHKPEHPKSHCEHHRDRVQTTSPEGFPLVGAFVPQCEANGQYIPLQCHSSTGHCWCVDSQGQERPGTRTSPGTTPTDCDKPDKPKTHCEHHRDGVQTTSPEGYPLVGAFVPQCDANGQYTAQQCHGSSGHCWCVDSQGQERPGTRTPPGTTPTDCDKPRHPKTHCEHHRDRVQTTSPEGYPLVGAFVPECDANGQYTPQQCHGSTGHCWCVDNNGQEITGTRTPPAVSPVDCHRHGHVSPTQRPESVCERWRTSLMEHYGGKPEPQQYLPQCEPEGQFSSVQCYGETTYCWCVDQDGREVPGTRSHEAVKPACLPSVAPPTVRPYPRPDVTPPPNAAVTLLYAQGQKIGALPLNGTRLDASRSKTILTLHGSIVVGLSYDCKENKVYWTDLSARSINRAALSPGAEPEILINSNLVSPEGLAVDVKRRLMFWVDSNPDLIERSNLDGSDRRTLFDTQLVNPRAIIVVSSTGSLYWTDWNREAPKIESSSVDGQNRRVVVTDGIGLPNALTFDSSSRQICWADAGTKQLECIFPDGSGRRVIHPSVNYPFSMVYHHNHFYYTDWRRDGVIALSKDGGKLTDEYLPDQRSHLYGIAIATSHCL
ncbi:nidogen-2 [Entelurus aequoreus]|uniref:nidogen-2 n=1 Tax=Entelurus aequoreus TaxID=161455 RepID=UPI002B1D4C43|nr:nidogen-2 [Entelurus aequoreus]XP_061909995.1 nidogen-2 [Entelurus aequoreus]